MECRKKVMCFHEKMCTNKLEKFYFIRRISIELFPSTKHYAQILFNLQFSKEFTAKTVKHSTTVIVWGTIRDMEKL